MIYDPAEYERPCEYLCLYCPNHDAFRKQVKDSILSSLIFSSLTMLSALSLALSYPRERERTLSIDRSIAFPESCLVLTFQQVASGGV